MVRDWPNFSWIQVDLLDMVCNIVRHLTHLKVLEISKGLTFDFILCKVRKYEKMPYFHKAVKYPMNHFTLNCLLFGVQAKRKKV